MPGNNGRMQAVILRIIPSGKAIGRTNDGFLVLLPRWGDVKSAKVGDKFSFIPEEPENLQGGIKFFGNTPKLEQRAICEPQEWPNDEPKDAATIPHKWGLPDHHARHYDKAGNLILPPRPRHLAAQRRELNGQTR